MLAALLPDDVPTRLIGFKEPLPFVNGIYENSIDPEMDWRELVVSWNAHLADGSTLTVKVCPQGASRWYTMGFWSDSKATRTSTKDQNSDGVKVDTDTLISANSARRVNVRFELKGAGTVDLAAFSFSKKPPFAASPAFGGKPICLEPPRRAQMSYPNGNVICSATATSMVLGYWSQYLGRPIVDRDVPLVCEGVFDPGWDGTGNWPFNTAFAGSVPGMQAYVSRLWNVSQLEAFIQRGIPVVCSVSYDLLKGKGVKGKSDGHLVVLVGFDEAGDPIFNDPGRTVVRMTYRRADFDEAWASSGRTCYLIYPRLYQAPENRERCWID